MAIVNIRSYIMHLHIGSYITSNHILTYINSLQLTQIARARPKAVADRILCEASSISFQRGSQIGYCIAPIAL